MEKIDKMYEKFNGSYFAFIGTGISLLSVFVAIFLFMIDVPNFSFITHYISDLGDGKNGSNVVFNIGRILSGIVLPFFYFNLMRYLQKNNGKKISTLLGFVSCLIAATGSILVGIYPSQTAPRMHGIAAAMAFSGMFLTLIFFSRSEHSIPEIPKAHSMSGFIVAPLPILYMIFYVLMNSIGFSREITLFFEWFTFFTMMAWVIMQGMYMFKLNKNK